MRSSERLVGRGPLDASARCQQDGRHLLADGRVGLEVSWPEDAVRAQRSGLGRGPGRLARRATGPLRWLPMGVIDAPFIPVSLALGAGATLVGRAMDRDPKHLQEMVRRAEHHHGSAFIEIYQNCNVFNDGAFLLFTEKETRDDHVVYLEHGKPLVFGKNKDRGIRLDGFTPAAVSLADGSYSVNDMLIHDENDLTLAFILANMIHNPELPRAMGVFVSLDRPTYEEQLEEQITRARSKKGRGDLQKLLEGEQTWTIV